jgi:two-component system, OmpR family, alkaline phosphatase synthesis response regulator PhoP
MLTHTIEKAAIKPGPDPAGDAKMKNLLIITADGNPKAALQQSMTENGFTCIATSWEDALDVMSRHTPHLVLAEMNSPGNVAVRNLIKRVKNDTKVPVIALVPADMLARVDNLPDIDDFITGGYNTAELLLRMKRLLQDSGSGESSEQIKCDGLTIDFVTCEVTVNGVKAELTFKEYELLKLMAGNRGRVFTRQALLDKIWGYDYFGGDRTVDVHIRRLRSKIEDPTHTYIETVRNIGYRFAKSTQSC